MPESMERGALTEAVYYILLSLHTRMHGYAIMQNINKLSAGRVALGPGTLYGALNTLLEKYWIEDASNNTQSRKKEYIITDKGKKVFVQEIERLEELLVNGRTIIGKRGGQ